MWGLSMSKESAVDVWSERDLVDDCEDGKAAVVVVSSWGQTWHGDSARWRRSIEKRASAATVACALSLARVAAADGMDDMEELGVTELGAKDTKVSALVDLICDETGGGRE